MSQSRVARNLAFEGECVGLFADIVSALGIPKSIGQIYGLLYASATPLSFSDIVERLKISKGSASQGLQLLRSLGAVNATDKDTLVSKAKMARRDYYEVELSLRRLVSGILQERITPLTATETDRLARLRLVADGSDFHLDRVKQLETWRRQLKTVLPILSALLGPKSWK